MTDAGPIGSGGTVYQPTFEYQFVLSASNVALDYEGTFICTLPACELDRNVDDSDNRNYAVVSGIPKAIEAYGSCAVDIYVIKGSVGSANITHIPTAGAYDEDCGDGGIPQRSVENYRHYYNKQRQISLGSFYGTFYGSLVTDNTFDPCPGSWGFSAGGVDYWCATNSGGPESPGRTTIRPKSGLSEGYAYRIVPD
ncbi:MAG: hypothetical protein ACE5F5_08745 [Acidimicrobiia bacterium]